MKKIISSLLLLFVSMPLYAQETNYSSVQDCVNDVLSHASKALDKNQASLSKWFTSFAHESDGVIDYYNNTITFHNGCHLIGTKSEELWKIMHNKLDQQIIQQNGNLSSLYGDRAVVICRYSDVTHRVMLDTCK